MKGLMKNLIRIGGPLAIALAPVAAFAQIDVDYFGDALVRIGQFVQQLIPFAAALALLFFFYGLALFILNAGNDDKRDEGKKVMFWGIIALFVIAALFGIFEWIGGIFGVNIQSGTFDVPNITP